MRFNNESAVKLSGTYDAKFLGFQAVPIAGKSPLIKATYELVNPKMKLDYTLGSKVDLDKLNNILTSVGKPAVKQISDIDLPAMGEVIPAEWDKLYKVEVFYPLKDGVPSNFASIKSIIGAVDGGSIPATAASVPSL